MTTRGDRAERLLGQALDEARNGQDVISAVGRALTVPRVEAGAPGGGTWPAPGVSPGSGEKPRPGLLHLPAGLARPRRLPSPPRMAKSLLAGIMRDPTWVITEMRSLTMTNLPRRLARLLSAALLLLCAAGLTACQLTVAAPAAHNARPGPGPAAALAGFSDSGRVTYSKAVSGCHTRDRGQLPDPACTPGSINPVVTQANIGSTICRGGWTATIRPPESETEHAKYEVVDPAYGIPASTTGELDHEVPLELGGSNDITNLWLEAGPIPNPKDKVEDTLNAAVCSHQVTLAAAQEAIARNWMTAEKTLGVSPSTGSW